MVEGAMSLGANTNTMSRHIVPPAGSTGYSVPQLSKKMAFATIAAKLEVKPSDNEYEAIESSRWGNRDIYPVAHDKRVYGVYDFISYWVSGANI